MTTMAKTVRALAAAAVIMAASAMQLATTSPYDNDHRRGGDIHAPEAGEQYAHGRGGQGRYDNRWSRDRFAPPHWNRNHRRGPWGAAPSAQPAPLPAALPAPSHHPHGAHPAADPGLPAAQSQRHPAQQPAGCAPRRNDGPDRPPDFLERWASSGFVHNPARRRRHGGPVLPQLSPERERQRTQQNR